MSSTRHSLEAEEACIYASMGDPTAAGDLARTLHRDDFFDARHKTIWSGIEALVRKGSPIDLVTLTAELQAGSLLQRSGGISYIGSLYDRPVLRKNYAEYGNIVRDWSRRRRLATVAADILQRCEGPESTTALLGDAEQLVMAVGRAGEVSSKPERLSRTLTATFDVIQEKFRDGSHYTGLTTGYRELDNMTGGFQPGNLILLAARPSMGKTSLALNIAMNACLGSDARVAFFSLEMSRDEVTQRILSSEGKVDSSKLRSGRLNDVDWGLLTEAAKSMADAQLYIDETGGLSHGELRARCHGLCVEAPLDLIVVDYIQLMRMPHGQNRNIQVGDISAALKALAKEMRCPVLALSQLSRQAASHDKEIRPALHHLRDSGSLEQDADMVLFVHRPEMMGVEDREGYAEIIVAKQRNGPVGEIQLQFIHEYTLFAEPPLGDHINHR